MRLILNSLTFFFQIHKSWLYFSNDEFFPLKFNDSYEKWRIVSMGQVQILKIYVLFAKIWLKNQGFVLFQIVFLCKQLYHQIHVFCFPSKLLFRFPFYSVFHSVPFSVTRFSNTRVDWPCFYLRLPVVPICLVCITSPRQGQPHLRSKHRNPKFKKNR